jgi:aspartyl-tRNA synthetase
MLAGNTGSARLVIIGIARHLRKLLTLARAGLINFLSRHGTSPHGGYGIGLERFIAWLAKQHSDGMLVPAFHGAV